MTAHRAADRASQLAMMRGRTHIRPYLVLRVRREQIIQTTIENLALYEDGELKKPLKASPPTIGTIARVLTRGRSGDPPCPAGAVPGGGGCGRGWGAEGVLPGPGLIEAFLSWPSMGW
jgi:hypothetical protein